MRPNATHYRTSHPRPIAWGRGESQSRCLAYACARRMRVQIKRAYTRVLGRNSNAFPAFRTKTKCVQKSSHTASQTRTKKQKARRTGIFALAATLKRQSTEPVAGGLCKCEGWDRRQRVGQLQGGAPIYPVKKYRRVVYGDD